MVVFGSFRLFRFVGRILSFLVVFGRLVVFSNFWTFLFSRSFPVVLGSFRSVDWLFWLIVHFWLFLVFYVQSVFSGGFRSFSVVFGQAVVLIRFRSFLVVCSWSVVFGRSVVFSGFRSFWSFLVDQ